MRLVTAVAVGVVLCVGTALAAQNAKQKDAPKAKAGADAPAAKPGADAPKAKVDPKELREKASYALGLSMGQQFRKQSVDLDPDVVAKGLREGLAGKGSLSEQEVRDVLNQYQEALKDQIAAKNKKEGEAFLAANAKKDGVRTLPSGVQYKVIKDGKGPKPKSTDTVSVNYEGTLIDGTKFDSSYDRGRPADFPVAGVIKGFSEALQQMNVGSHWKVYIPSALAYGENPRQGGPIGPNAVLVFDIDLLKID
jgi:FKBP-type peptidyl-prolyl cis-trans isomerase